MLVKNQAKSIPLPLEKDEGLRVTGMLLIVILPLLMLATRTDHFGSIVSLPDASRAVFLLAGFYFRRFSGFILLCALAAAIDYWVVATRVVDDFCVTAAYGFLLPSYFVVWFAGRWLLPRTENKILLIATVIISLVASYLISGGSYYLFSGQFTEFSWVEYIGRVTKYLPRSVFIPLGYLAVAALFHYLFSQEALRSEYPHD